MSAGDDGAAAGEGAAAGAGDARGEDVDDDEGGGRPRDSDRGDTVEVEQGMADDGGRRGEGNPGGGGGGACLLWCIAAAL